MSLENSGTTCQTDNAEEPLFQDAGCIYFLCVPRSVRIRDINYYTIGYDCSPARISLYKLLSNQSIAQINKTLTTTCSRCAKDSLPWSLAWTTGESNFGYRGKKYLFLFATSSNPAPRPTQHHIQGVSISTGLNRPGREPDHSPRCRRDVMNMLSWHTQTFHL